MVAVAERRKNPPVPSWITYEIKRDAETIRQSCGSWESAAKMLKELCGKYHHKSRCKGFLYMMELRRYIDREDRDGRERASEKRGKRLALAVKLIKSVMEEDNADLGRKAENETIRHLLPILEGDAPDTKGLLTASIEAGDIDLADLLQLAVGECDRHAKQAFELEDYGRMNRWNEDGHALATLPLNHRPHA